MSQNPQVPTARDPGRPELSQEQEMAWDTLWRIFPNQFNEMGLLEDKLDYRFRNPHLLHQALLHRSALISGQPISQKDLDRLPWNERIEFLGDAVLDLIVSHHLWYLEESYTEGELSQLRASLVNEQRLATIARELDLGRHLILGRGEVKGGGIERDALLADAVEAIVGAIYVDGGYNAAFGVLKRLYEPHWLELSSLRQDYKTMLQEWTQKHHQCIPEYKLVADGGPDHARRFRIGVYLNGEPLAEAEGRSKKRASQIAAELAFKIVQEQKIQEQKVQEEV